MVPYLLSIYSLTPNTQRHLDSTKKLTCEHINIRLDTYPGHQEKWRHFPKGLDPERHLIFLDTDDVLVQKDLPELTDDIYVGAENILHKDTIWKDVIKETGLSELSQEPVYNVGSFAMKVKYFYQFIDLLFTIKHPLADQLMLNKFLLGKEKTANLEMFCPLFANYFQGVTKDKVWKTGGKVISIVHANGSDELKRLLW
jgi:hypothetical protein